MKKNIFQVLMALMKLTGYRNDSKKP